MYEMVLNECYVLDCAPQLLPQYGYLAGLNSDRSWMLGYSEKVVRQRDVCIERISQIEGLEVQSSGGAFYMFVRLTDEKWANDDKQFVL